MKTQRLQEIKQRRIREHAQLLKDVADLKATNVTKTQILDKMTTIFEIMQAQIDLLQKQITEANERLKFLERRDRARGLSGMMIGGAHRS